MQPVNIEALRQIKTHQRVLTKQQLKTLRGQVLAGDSDGAMKGLQKILEKRSREDD